MSTTLNTQTVQLPAGRVRLPVITYGNYFKLVASSVSVRVKFIGNNVASEKTFRRGEWFVFEPGASYQKLEMWRSENDTNPDVPYNVEFTYGTLADGALAN